MWEKVPGTVQSALKRLVTDHAARGTAGVSDASPREVGHDGHPVYGERRREARYIPVMRRAYLGWWDGGTFRTAPARVENLSRSGAAVLVDDSPAGSGPVWLCLIGPVRPDWHAGDAVDVTEAGGVGRVVRIALSKPLPYDIFKSIVWGIPSEAPPVEAAQVEYD